MMEGIVLIDSYDEKVVYKPEQKPDEPVIIISSNPPNGKFVMLDPGVNKCLKIQVSDCKNFTEFMYSCLDISEKLTKTKIQMNLSSWKQFIFSGKNKLSQELSNSDPKNLFNSGSKALVFQIASSYQTDPCRLVAVLLLFQTKLEFALVPNDVYLNCKTEIENLLKKQQSAKCKECYDDLLEFSSDTYFSYYQPVPGILYQDPKDSLPQAPHMSEEMKPNYTLKTPIVDERTPNDYKEQITNSSLPYYEVINRGSYQIRNDFSAPDLDGLTPIPVDDVHFTRNPGSRFRSDNHQHQADFSFMNQVLEETNPRNNFDFTQRYNKSDPSLEHHDMMKHNTMLNLDTTLAKRHTNTLQTHPDEYRVKYPMHIKSGPSSSHHSFNPPYQHAVIDMSANTNSWKQREDEMKKNKEKSLKEIPPIVHLLMKELGNAFNSIQGSTIPVDKFIEKLITDEDFIKILKDVQCKLEILDAIFRVEDRFLKKLEKPAEGSKNHTGDLRDNDKPKNYLINSLIRLWQDFAPDRLSSAHATIKCLESIDNPTLNFFNKNLAILHQRVELDITPEDICTILATIKNRNQPGVFMDYVMLQIMGTEKFVEGLNLYKEQIKDDEEVLIDYDNYLKACLQRLVPPFKVSEEIGRLISLAGRCVIRLNSYSEMHEDKFETVYRELSRSHEQINPKSSLASKTSIDFCLAVISISQDSCPTIWRKLSFEKLFSILTVKDNLNSYSRNENPKTFVETVGHFFTTLINFGGFFGKREDKSVQSIGSDRQMSTEALPGTPSCQLPEEMINFILDEYLKSVDSFVIDLYNHHCLSQSRSYNGPSNHYNNPCMPAQSIRSTVLKFLLNINIARLKDAAYAFMKMLVNWCNELVQGNVNTGTLNSILSRGCKDDGDDAASNLYKSIVELFIQLEVFKSEDEFFRSVWSSGRVREAVDKLKDLLSSKDKIINVLDTWINGAYNIFERLDKGEPARHLHILRSKPESIYSRDIQNAFNFYTNNVPSIRALELTKYKYFNQQFEERVQQVGNLTMIPLSELSKISRLSENAFSTFLKKFKEPVLKKDVKTLLDMRQELENNKSNLIEGMNIINQDAFNRLTEIMALVKLYEMGDEVFTSIHTLTEYLHEKKIITTSSRDNCISIIEKLSEERKQYLSNSEKCTFVKLTNKEHEFLKSISLSTEFIIKIKDCIPIINHFISKEPKHFQDLILERDSNFKLETSVITSAQNLVEIFRSNTKTGNKKSVKFSEFLESLDKMSSKIKIQLLTDNANKLIECSKDRLKDNSDGSSSAESIINDSVIAFVFDTKTRAYRVTCDIGATLDEKIGVAVGTGSKKKKTDDVSNKRRGTVSYEKMKDTKVKIALFKATAEADDKENESGFKYLLNLFTSLMDNVDSILRDITSLINAGAVLDIEAVILSKLSEIQIRINQNLVDSFSTRDVEQTRNLFAAKKFDLYIKVKHNSVDPTFKALTHIELLKKVFEHEAKQQEMSMLINESWHHNLTLLEGQQKVDICNFFLSPPINTDADYANTYNKIESLLRFATQDSQLDLTEAMSKVQNLPKSYITNEVLHFIMLKLSKEEIAPEIMDSELTYHRSQSALRKKIHFSTFNHSKNKFGDLFKIIASKEITKIEPFQIYFCTPFTSNDEIKTFLCRALKDKMQRHYFMMDLHLLTEEMSGEFLRLTTRMVDKAEGLYNFNLILLLDRENKSSSIHPSLLRHDKYFEEETFNFDKFSKSDKLKALQILKSQVKAQVVLSDNSGMGKSYYIESEAKKQKPNSNLESIIISGDTSREGIEKRLEILKDICRVKDDSQITLHLKVDMMDNMEESVELVDQFVFRLCYLKCLNFKGGYLYFNKVRCFFIEVQNSFKNLLMDKVSLFSLLDKHEIFRLRNVSDLEKAIDVSTWRKGSEMIHALVVFWDSLNNNTFGNYNLNELLKSNSVHPSKNKISKVIVDILSQGRRDVKVEQLLENTSFMQINTLVRILYFQISQMGLVSGLDPSIFATEQDHQELREYMKRLAKSRITTARGIVDLAVELVWNGATEIRKETTMAKEIASEKKENAKRASTPENLAQEVLSEYKRKIEAIPKWEFAERVNFFFNEGAFKIIYKNVNDVSQDIKNVVLLQTQKNIVDYTTLKPDQREQVLFEELTQALDLARWNMTAEIKEKVRQFNGKGYVITPDNYIKILMIIQRAMLGIPIVIMGATGCGKTYMVSFIAKCLLQEEMLCFTLHAGVTEDALVNILLEAVAIANRSEKRIWILFDEFNTSPLQCLIAEVMLDRKSSFCEQLRGIEFPQNMVLIAACNPYRIEAQTTTVGLVYEKSSVSLSHRVYPIPDTMLNCVWDFGQLTPEVELQYIHSMLAKDEELKDDSLLDLICNVISRSQNFLRTSGSGNSVSLRDVSRYIKFYLFFKDFFTECDTDPIVLATTICYFLGLDSKDKKNELGVQLDAIMPARDHNHKFMERINHLSNSFANDLNKLEVIPKDISLNKPLKENLLASWCCLNTLTPLIICGKPGTSKTLSLSIIYEAMNKDVERKNDSEYFRNSKRLVFINYWGSLTTTSASIQEVFNKANQTATELFNEGQETIVSVVFDEIGLAEIAQENPLKVLHPLLDPEERVSGFVGLSNWRLDQSKMNRVVYVCRPDMDIEDLKDTCRIDSLRNGAGIYGGKPLDICLNGLASAFYKFRQEECKSNTHQNFHGSRDFYETVKILGRSIQAVEVTQSKFGSMSERDVINALVLNAIQRGFSGKLSDKTGSLAYHRMIELYAQESKCAMPNLPELKSIELIYQNIIDNGSRHLMILTQSSSLEEIIVSQIREFEILIRRKNPSKFEYLSQGRNTEDMTPTVMAKLPLFIKNGYTVVMKGLDEVYGCLYDLLNQNYSRSEIEGQNQCSLFYDNVKHEVTVHPEFKCIVLMERIGEGENRSQASLERTHQPPFLNRFEKYLIVEEDFVPVERSQVKSDLEELFIKKRSGVCHPSTVIHNLSKELIFSIVVRDTSHILNQMNLEKTVKGTSDFDSVLLNLLEKASHLKDKSSKGRRNMNRTKEIREKSNDEMDYEQVPMDDTDLTNIVRLFSRNMILVNKIAPKLYSLPINETKFKQMFLETHKFDDLGAVVNSLQNKPHDRRKAIIFTYSSSWELKEIASQKQYLFHIDSSELLAKGMAEQSKTYGELLSDSGIVLIVVFSKKSDWHSVQRIRHCIENATMAPGKIVIFSMHYTTEDFRNPILVDTSVTYLSSKWEMAVIDDLKGCDYKKFFDDLDKACFKVLQENLDSQTRCSENSLGRELVHEGLKHYIIQGARGYRELIRGSRVVDLLSDDGEILDRLCRDILKIKQASKPLSDLFTKESNIEDLFIEFLDAKHLMSYKMKEYFYKILSNPLRKFEEKVEFKTISMVGLIMNNDARKEIIGRINNILLEKQDEDSEESEAFKHADTITIKSKEFQDKHMPAINDLRQVIWTRNEEEDPRLIVSKLKNICNNPTNNSYIRNPCGLKLTTPHELLVVGLCVLEKYLSTNLPIIDDDYIITIIFQIIEVIGFSSDGDELLSSHEKVLTLFVVIAEVYLKELTLLQNYSQNLSSEEKLKLAMDIMQEYQATVRIDITPLINSLSELAAIEVRADAELQLSRLNHYNRIMRLTSNTSSQKKPALTKEFLQEQDLVISVILFLSRINSITDFDAMKEIYNSTLQIKQSRISLSLNFLSSAISLTQNTILIGFVTQLAPALLDIALTYEESSRSILSIFMSTIGLVIANRTQEDKDDDQFEELIETSRTKNNTDSGLNQQDELNSLLVIVAKLLSQNILKPLLTMKPPTVSLLPDLILLLRELPSHGLKDKDSASTLISIQASLLQQILNCIESSLLDTANSAASKPKQKSTGLQSLVKAKDEGFTEDKSKLLLQNPGLLWILADGLEGNLISKPTEQVDISNVVTNYGQRGIFKGLQIFVELFGQSQNPEILFNERVIFSILGLRSFSRILKQESENSYGYLLTEESRRLIANFNEQLLNAFGKSDSSTWTTLLAARSLYSAVPDPSTLKRLGIPWISDRFEEWTDTDETGFFGVDETSSVRMSTLRNALRNLNSEQQTELLSITNFEERLELLNMVLRPNTPKLARDKGLAICRTNFPILAKYIESCITVRDVLTEEEEKNMNLLYAIGVVLSLIEGLPPYFLYSVQSLANGQFKPLVNYPSEELKKSLPIVQLANRQGADFKAVWECRTPGCGMLIPVGDCGRLGHLGHASISSICLGCKRPIGVYADNRDPNLVQRDLNSVIQRVQNLLMNDEQPFREDPTINEGTFDESWILDKYNNSVYTRAEAIFIYLFQAIALLIHRLKSNFSGESIHTLVINNINPLRISFNHLSKQIEKDEESTLLFFVMVISKLDKSLRSNQEQLSRQPQNITRRNHNQADGNSEKGILTSELKLRRCICETFTQAYSRINGMLGEHSRRKAEVQEETIKIMTRSIAFVQGNQGVEDLKKLPASVAALWRLILPSKPPKITDIFGLLDAATATPKAKFLRSLIEQKRLLSELPTLLSCLQEFTMYVSQKLDTRLSSSKATRFTLISALANIESLYEKERAQKNKKKQNNIIESDEESDTNQIIPQNNPNDLEKIDQTTRNILLKMQRVWSEILLPLMNEFSKLLALRYECQDLNNLIGKLESIAYFVSPVAAYTVNDIPASKWPSADMVAIRVVIETLINYQNKWIDEYSQFCTFTNTQSSASELIFSRRPFHKAQNESFIGLKTDIEDDLKLHTSVIYDEDLSTHKLAIDIDYLSSKYANELFSNSSLLTLEPYFFFTDSESRHLEELIQRLFKRLKITPKLDIHGENISKISNHRQSLKDLQILLKIIISRILDKETQCLPNSSLMEFVEMTERNLVPKQLLEIIRIEDLESARRRILLESYPSAEKFAKEKHLIKLYLRLENRNTFIINELQTDETHLIFKAVEDLKIAFSSTFANENEMSEKEIKMRGEADLSDHGVNDDTVNLIKRLLLASSPLTLSMVPSLIRDLEQLSLEPHTRS
jgi:hypothetical protein